jgi:hypothetical protein
MKHVEECQNLRAEVFRWYRIVSILRDALSHQGSARDTGSANAKRRKTLAEQQRWHRKLKMLAKGVSIETLLSREHDI